MLQRSTSLEMQQRLQLRLTRGAGRIKADNETDANIRMTVTTGSGGDTIDFGDLDSNDTVILVQAQIQFCVSLADGSTTTLATTYNLSNVGVFQAAGAADASITVSGAGQAGLETIRFVENTDTSNDNGDTYTASGLASGVSVQLNNTVNNRDMNTVTGGCFRTRRSYCDHGWYFRS